MKVFPSRYKNIAYFLYRIINPIFDPIKVFMGLYGHLWFFRDIVLYKIMDKKARLFSINIFPILNEKTPLTNFDAHYFHQQIWAFENIMNNRPQKHVDIGSTYQMSGYLSKIVSTEFVDIRPIDTKLKNLSILKGDIMNLPYNDSSLESVSCLHVVEHIGLGRYGDHIDPDGPRKACAELARVIKKGGALYFSVPVGKPRICFNAHRIFSADQVLKMLSAFKLINLYVVDDEGEFKKVSNKTTKYLESLNFGLGLFEFHKKK